MSTVPYTPADDRYKKTAPTWFRPCGRSGLKLPAISLGCWHNFGDLSSNDDSARKLLYTAFDLGITHFDLANNYGPPPGSAESRVGRILKTMPRDELIVSSKAGFAMWQGPYGNHGSRKYLLASLDQSLRRLDLDYVDIFYHHSPDPDTPIDETLGALDHAVRSGKALYVGLSNYRGSQVTRALDACAQHRYAKPIIHQPPYNMLDRGPETDLLPVTRQLGLGVIAFCPLAQGLLTSRYLKGIPDDSRAASKTGFLKRDRVSTDVVTRAQALNNIAQNRGQTLAQMALAWVLRLPGMTSALIGASRTEQIVENVAALENARFSADELAAIEVILASKPLAA